jgi:hypothetical protein
MIVDRCVYELVRGRYGSPSEATRDCARDLDRLHARHPGEVWASAPRTAKSVQQRITERLNDLGDTWSGADFLPRENRTIDYYVQQYMNGRYPNLKHAALDCWRELRRQADRLRRRTLGLTGTPAPRKLKAVSSQLELRTRALGRPSLARPWTAPEVRVARKWTLRYVTACKRGTGPSRAEAIAATARELEQQGYARRTPEGYRGAFEKLLERTAAARSRPGRRWTAAEMETARHWVRVYQAARRDGMEFFQTEAARALKAELAKGGYSRSERGCEGIVERLLRVARRGRTDGRVGRKSFIAVSEDSYIVRR